MIEGAVYKNRPLISITIGSRLGVQEIVALIDTGFTGELKLPEKKASELGLVLTHTERIRLADDSEIDMPASLVLVSMEGVRDTISTLISRGMPIIGVGLLKRFKYILNIDFKHDILTLNKENN